MDKKAFAKDDLCMPGVLHKASRSYQNITSGTGSKQHLGDVYGGVVNNTNNVYHNDKTFHDQLLDSLYFPGMHNYQTRTAGCMPLYMIVSAWLD
ncbi:hypothetical protein Slin15195_G038630 [Septoria linicola]|uniref:Uncharacterized protein n=1 Tax=Septoria linicola TaxID=215465 RepID=A0A9Q9AM13_9PEZI|nr:hypothetical protein Slin14017_G120040 [Septoria linicola]USW50544.1 hypothetical protein Slin15195_G038630 [Septoria linicola]